MPNTSGGPTRPSAPGIPGTVWHTEQPAFVKISVIGSSPVTNGTLSGASTGTDEVGRVVTEEGLRERRANNVPSSSATTMRGVIDRSGMEPIAGKVRQGRNRRNHRGRVRLTLYRIADTHRPAPLISAYPWHSEIRSSDPRNPAQLRTAPSPAMQRVHPAMTPLARPAFHQ